MNASDQDASENDVTDDEVVAAATTLGEKLAVEKESSSESAFTNIVMQCNEAIGNEIGIDYGSVCGDDDCC